MPRLKPAALIVAVALAGCGSAPPPAAEPEEEFALMRASQAALEARLAALEERVGKVEAVPASPVTMAAQPPDAPLTGPLEVGRHHYRVPRKYFDEMLENPDETMREARAVPVKDGNRTTGLRLFGIRSGTRLNVLGFQNGDQLRSLNDAPLTTPDQALRAYGAARNSDTLRVRLLRRGQSVEMRYDLVD